MKKICDHNKLVKRRLGITRFPMRYRFITYMQKIRHLLLCKPVLNAQILKGLFK